MSQGCVCYISKCKMQKEIDALKAKSASLREREVALNEREKS